VEQRPRPWEQKNPVVSGVLAYLVPGLGHFYQGRWVKGLIYFSCILGTFFGGLRLGEGAVVYNDPPPGSRRGVTLNYLGQIGVGLVALPGFYQRHRAEAPGNRPLTQLSAPLTAPFTGEVEVSGPGQDDASVAAVGTITLSTNHEGAFPETSGEFNGTVGGKPTTLALLGGFSLDRAVSAGFRRGLTVAISPGEDHPESSRMLKGSIPRALIDAYAAPPDDATLQSLHRRLGKLYQLAITCTVIAGLLNILAVWDAVEGPAYGFGDEPHGESSQVSGSTAVGAAAVVGAGGGPRPTTASKPPGRG
jgi:hypothetical protein